MAYTKDQLAQLVVDYAHRFGINPAIALVQIKRESDNFRPDVVYGPFRAPAGERGMSQFTPGAWADWGSGPHTNAFDPDASLTAWGRYMTWLLNRYGGDYSKALMGYNGGPGNVDRGRVSSAAQRYAREVMAQAGSTPLPSPGGGGYFDTAGDLPPDESDDPQSESSWTVPILIGAAAIVALVLISD